MSPDTDSDTHTGCVKLLKLLFCTGADLRFMSNLIHRPHYTFTSIEPYLPILHVEVQ